MEREGVLEGKREERERERERERRERKKEKERFGDSERCRTGERESE